MISALNWIPRGKPKANPEKYKPSESEIDELKKSKREVEAAEKEAKKIAEEEGDIEKLYDMDNYDDDDEEEKGRKFMTEAQVEDDPNIQLESEDEEDLDDMIIRDTDSILLSITANDEDDLSHLDVYLFEEANHNLYVHHDVFLDSFPLCVSWLDYNPTAPTTPGNFAAVGCFTPGIQIWDLDVIDAVYPVITLGGEDKTVKSKKPKYLEGSHTDAVMGLDWNRHKRNLLASSSADKSVKIWDLAEGNCLQTYTQHKDKVQSVQWNSQEPSVVLCGSYDKTVTILDVRSNSSDVSLRWKVSADVEAIQWNPRSPQHFFVACEDGTLSLFDAMKGGNSAPVWTLAAHNKATSALAINAQIPIFATGSTDRTIKVWNYGEGKPVLLETLKINKNMFSLSFFNASAPHLLAYGGDHSAIGVMNLHKYATTAPLFGVEFKGRPRKDKKSKGSDDEMEDEVEEKASEDEENEDMDSDDDEQPKDKKKKLSLGTHDC